MSSSDGFSCVPTKFDSALVETPNKVDLIQTVVACELKESCYRVPYKEYYYEAVHTADGIREERLEVGEHMSVSLFLSFLPSMQNSIVTFNQALLKGSPLCTAYFTPAGRFI